MIKSKAWKWEMLSKDNTFWNTPAPIVYYLKERWLDFKFKSFLDIGCGLGRHTIFMAKAGFKVSGFDLSEHSVNITNEKLKEQNLKAKVITADMLKFPYKDNSFDCMLAMNVISHTDKIGFKQILSEIYRCLKPEGEIYFTLGSKDSYWYNNPVCPTVDSNTKIRIEDGPENGIPHFYVDDDDCKTMFNNFKPITIEYIKQLTDYGTFSPHYFLHLKK